MRPLGRFPALGLLLLVAFSADGQSFLEWKGLKAGPYGVGFRAVATTDATRTWRTPTDFRGRPRPAFGNRPVQVSIWYPTEAASVATAMTYGDYVDLLAWETGPPTSGTEVRKTAREQFQRMSGLPVTAEGTTAFERLYQERVRAARDARPAPGRFPVLISAPGQGYPAFDNSVMSEFLASHGFIVIASPSMGPDGRDMPDSPLAIDSESRDLEFLAGFVQTLPQADPDRVAAIGFSLGGAPAALFALRNARVKALVSLDGVLRDDRYLKTLSAFPGFRPEQLRAALLWIACSPANSLPGFEEGSFPEAARHADLTRAVFPGLLHHDLSSMSSLQRRRAQDAGKDWTSATVGYEAACRLILAFLESRLNGVERKLDGEPETVCKVTGRPARKAPPTPADFREVAATEGLGAAAQLLRGVRKEFPEALPSFEETAVLFGYETLAAGDAKLAIQAFRLAVECFPDSIDGSWGLGKACLAEGSLEEAASSYGVARTKVEKSPVLSAEQKTGILTRVDKILADIAAKREGKP
ncbi:MAG TPA: alpha/beta fold hydrolase [Thermoanaerobaculia bacterium]|nr:alpha/beta fold hydrolase [Thermoanaerobaculia bacterium]